MFVLLLTACDIENSPTGEDFPTSTAEDSPSLDDVITSAPTQEVGETAISELTPTPEETEPTPNEPKRPPNPNVPYDEAVKATLDESIEGFGQRAGIDVDAVIYEVYDEYSELLNVNIGDVSIRVAVSVSASSSFRTDDNVTGISAYAFEHVNSFLNSKGKDSLEINNPKHNIAALWLAASLFYDPNYDGEFSNEPYFDVAVAFGYARSNSNEINMTCADAFFSRFLSLYGGPANLY